MRIELAPCVSRFLEEVDVLQMCDIIYFLLCHSVHIMVHLQLMTLGNVFFFAIIEMYVLVTFCD